MTTMTFDKLAYLDRLKAAGFNDPQARAMADGLDQALREEVATKSDVAVLRNEIDLLRVEVKSDLAAFRGEVKNDLAAFRGEVKNDLAALRGVVNNDLATLRGEFNNDLATLRGELKNDLGMFRGELSGVRGELSGLRGELLAAIKADKVDLLKWVVMLIVGQTAIFTALKLLGR